MGEDFADHCELQNSRNEQVCPIDTPERLRRHRRRYIGYVNCQLAERTKNGESKERGELFGQPAPPKQNPENKEKDVGRNPKVVPEW